MISDKISDFSLVRPGKLIAKQEIYFLFTSHVVFLLLDVFRVQRNDSMNLGLLMQKHKFKWHLLIRLKLNVVFQILLLFLELAIHLVLRENVQFPVGQTFRLLGCESAFFISRTTDCKLVHRSSHDAATCGFRVLKFGQQYC
jgi:hypothetical protein